MPWVSTHLDQEGVLVAQRLAELVHRRDRPQVHVRHHRRLVAQRVAALRTEVALRDHHCTNGDVWMLARLCTSTKPCLAVSHAPGPGDSQSHDQQSDCEARPDRRWS